MTNSTKDVYFLPAYGELYEKIELGQCVTFKFECEYGIITNMFIRRPVPWLIDGEQFFDAITPYGYGGPLIESSIETKKLLTEYHHAWQDYCAQNKIVCEFVRFHLFDNQDIRQAFEGDIVRASDNVVRGMASSLEDMWMEFEHKVRKNVNKARNAGLSVLIDGKGDRLEEFLKIYYETMDRNRADAYYYFDRFFFEKICCTLQGNFTFFHVLIEDKIVSTELVLCSERYAYSFLGGTLSEYYAYRPNDLLKYEIINWCKQSGKMAFVLGGGYRHDDGIYKYKKAFAPEGDVPFYIGKRVHNTRIYDRLVALRSALPEFDPMSGFFPLYRS